MRPAITEMRKDILRIIEESDVPVTAKKIREMLKVSPDNSTIYRALRYFQEQNLIKSLAFSDHVQYFFSTGRPHNHFVLCRECRRMDPFDSCAAHHLQDTVEQQMDYEITDHFFYFIGICRNCRTHGGIS